jgi:ribA/ribD-fused uncharacterized protein
MSGIYNETDKYERWRQYAIHDDNNVKGFFGEYRWLSNFQKCEIRWDGIVYPSSENAYQACKVFPCDRHLFQDCSPAESKRLWKTLAPAYTPEDWDRVKGEIMLGILFEKFYHNHSLRYLLIETKNKYLEETNHWNDKYWGVDYRNGGQNNLGKFLMKIRQVFQ